MEATETNQALDGAATPACWVIVTNAGTDEQSVIDETHSFGLAMQLRAELHDPTSDVMKRLPSGELTTEF